MPKPNFFASPRKLKANSSPSSTRSPTDTHTATTTTTNNDNFTSRSIDNPSSSLPSGSTALASQRASNGNDDTAVGLKSPAQVRKVAAQRRKDKGVKKSASSSASTVSPTRASLRSSRSDRGVLMSCMYLGAVPESVLPHVTRAVSDVERVVFPALLVELRKQAAWDIPAEVRVPRDSATPASAHLSIVRAVVAGTADTTSGGGEVPVDVLVRVGPTNPVLTSKARPYRKLLAAWTDDGLVHIMQFPRSADVKTVAKAAARARMAQTDDDGTPHTREQGSTASTSSAEASSSPSGSDGESGTPDARSGEYGFSPAVEPSSMSSPPTAAEMRIKSAGERFHGALDAICAELRVRTSVLQEVSSRGLFPIAHALQRCIQHMPCTSPCLSRCSPVSSW